MDVTAEHAYLFRHAVVRDAAYSLQVPSERAELHGFALEILEAIPQLNRRALGLELAEHARMAQASGRDEARFANAEREYLKLGADHARFNYDYTAALAAVERLFELLQDQPAQRAHAADMTADILQRLGRWAESLEYFEIVHRDSDDPLYRGRALVHLAWVGLDMGRDVEALAAEGEALAESADSHQLRIAFMMFRARQAAEAGGDPTQAMQEIIDYARRTGDHVQELVAGINAAQYEITAGRLAEAAAHLDAAEALTVAPTMRHMRITVVLTRAQLAVKADDFAGTLRYAAEAAEAGVATGSRGLVGSAWVNMAVALTGVGEHAQAWQRLQDTQPIIAETTDVALAASWLKAYAELMRAWGKPAEAIPVLEEGLRDLEGRAPAATLEALRTELTRCTGS